MNTMTDRKPYLLRAMYDWIIDNGCTPYLVIAQPRGKWLSGVPQSYLNEEMLVLNVSPQASPDFVIANDCITLTTRFAGQPCQVAVLVSAIASIFAKETHEGMGFEIDESLADAIPESNEHKVDHGENRKKSSRKQAGHLKIIK